MKKSTKERIIMEAFKLFASKPYEKVTFAELEKVAKLTRGAILYHTRTKEILYHEVMRYYIFQTATAASIQAKDELSLKTFILACINECTREVERMKEIGINNINLAKLNIESQGFYYYPKMKTESINWISSQYAIWEKVITRAILTKEINPIAEPHDIASLFINQYLGISYSGIVRDNGIDLRQLRKNLFQIYDLLKNKQEQKYFFAENEF